MKQYKSQIDETKAYIKKVFPYAANIKVNIKKAPDGQYNSFIFVTGPQRKRLFAIKKDQEAKKSLEKALFAIVKQVNKIKEKWNRTAYKSMRYMQPI